MNFLLKKFLNTFREKQRYACSPQKSFEILRNERRRMSYDFDVTPVDLAGGHCYRSPINPCKSTASLEAVAYG